jgi:hypothetical protein
MVRILKICLRKSATQAENVCLIQARDEKEKYDNFRRRRK